MSMVLMSDVKYSAIVKSGTEIWKRYISLVSIWGCVLSRMMFVLLSSTSGLPVLRTLRGLLLKSINVSL